MTQRGFDARHLLSQASWMRENRCFCMHDPCSSRAARNGVTCRTEWTRPTLPVSAMQLSDDKAGRRQFSLSSLAYARRTLSPDLDGLPVLASSSASWFRGPKLGHARLCVENAVDSFSSALSQGGSGAVARPSEAVLELREKQLQSGSQLRLWCWRRWQAASRSLPAEQEELTHLGSLLALASPSVLVFLVLGLIKLHIGYADSPSMRKDGRGESPHQRTRARATSATRTLAAAARRSAATPGRSWPRHSVRCVARRSLSASSWARRRQWRLEPLVDRRHRRSRGLGGAATVRAVHAREERAAG